MYETEIHDALSQRDLDTVWKLMMKRSVWLQRVQLSPDDALQALQDTGEIEDRIRAQMAAIEKELITARQGYQATAAYERGRQV